MQVVDADEVAKLLSFDRLVPALRDGFIQGAEAPLRHQHSAGAAGTDASLLLMPAWSPDYIGVKVVNIFPHNGALGMPSIAPVYLLASARTGEQHAVIEGKELTRRRTAGASALAASYLAKRDASTLLVLGAGKVAEVLPHAHRAVRPIERVVVWNRSPEHALSLVERLRGEGFEAAATDDLEVAVRDADIVSAATLSSEPLIKGEWLQPGTHVDLIGSYAPHLREADDEAVRRATVFIDTHDAVEESGDLIDPLASGALTESAIAATLYDLTRGVHGGRRDDDELTLFKSVGTALEDLAAGTLVYESLSS